MSASSNNETKEFLGGLATRMAIEYYGQDANQQLKAKETLLIAGGGYSSVVNAHLWKEVFSIRIRKYSGYLSYALVSLSEFGIEAFQRQYFVKDQFISFAYRFLISLRNEILKHEESTQLKDLPKDEPLLRAARNLWLDHYVCEEVQLQQSAIVVFQNGIYNLRTGEFTADSNAPIRYSNPICADYVEDAQTPLFDDFLLRNFPNDPETRSLILRIIAYMSTTSASLQKFFWWYGIGGSGKSCLADLICSLVGRSNTAILTWDSINEKFSQAKILNKLIVKVDEWSDCHPKEQSRRLNTVKRFTSGGLMPVQNKFQNETDEVLTSKFLFIANRELPAQDEDFRSIKRRMVPILFRNPIKEGEQQTNYHLTILVQEADEIASAAVRELSAEVIKQGTGKIFDVAESVALQEGRECYDNLGDCVSYMFELDFMFLAPTASIPTRMLLEIAEYLRQVTSKAMPAQPERLIKAEMRAKFNIDSKLKKLSRKAIRAYIGVGIDKDNLLEKLPDLQEYVQESPGRSPKLAEFFGIEEVSSLNLLTEDVYNATN